MVAFVEPVSTNRKNSRLSFASFRQILTRIRKSFLLNASSASIQLAATEPDARTNCRIIFDVAHCSSQLLYKRTHQFRKSKRPILKVSWFRAVFHFLELEFDRLLGI